jgi:hypothetical protein
MTSQAVTTDSLNVNNAQGPSAGLHGIPPQADAVWQTGVRNSVRRQADSQMQGKFGQDAGASREGLHMHAAEREIPADGPNSPPRLRKNCAHPNQDPPRNQLAPQMTNGLRMNLRHLRATLNQIDGESSPGTSHPRAIR